MRSTSSFVTRISPGPVMALGMALIGGGDATNAALTGGFQCAFWVCGAIALLAPATTALILRRKRASEIDGAVPALEVGGVN